MKKNSQPSNYPDAYGEQHKEERLNKLVKNPSCLVSGETNNVQAHHSHPRSIGFGSYGDLESNYIILTERYHVDVHKAGHMDNNLLNRRKTVARRLWKDPKNEKEHEKLRRCDETLIPEYIDGLLDKLIHYVRERVVRETLINAFKTNRDLQIKIHALEMELESVRKKLRKNFDNNIMENG